MQCPKCGGDCWDNGPSKAQGKVKPNAPDYACKNKDGCGWKQWPPKGKFASSPPVTGYAKEQAPREPLSERPAALREAGDPLPWETDPRDEKAVLLFWDCFDKVLSGISKRKLTDGYSSDNIAALTATLYIARSKIN